MKLSDIYSEIRGNEPLYHYTHTKNISKIRERGYILSRLYLKSENIKPEYISNKYSRDLDDSKNYDKYVFLTFTKKHPFIYKNNDLVQPIKLHISLLDEGNVCITDKVANSNDAKLYTVKEALYNLDINSCKNFVNDRNKWNIAKKYEILVPNYIELSKFAIHGLLRIRKWLQEKYFLLETQ